MFLSMHGSTMKAKYSHSMEVFIRHVTETDFTGLLTGWKYQEISSYEYEVEVTCASLPASTYNRAISVPLIAAADFYYVINT